MIPNTEKAVEKAYEFCEKRRKFVPMEKERYSDYIDESQSDLLSAEEEEIKKGKLKWAIVKIYQSLFLLCNAFLIKNIGFYSKDHGCLIYALMKNKIISLEITGKLNQILEKKNLFEEISETRIERNQALYFPKTIRKISDEEIKKTYEHVKKIILSLSGEI